MRAPIHNQEALSNAPVSATDLRNSIRIRHWATETRNVKHANAEPRILPTISPDLTRCIDLGLLICATLILLEPLRGPNADR